MALTLAEKILAEHLVSGAMRPGEEIAIRIDQTLTQDATGTMAYLQFEAMGVPRVRTELSVSYVDHNMLQSGFENADDHRFLQSIAHKHGVYFSRPGNGICHQVHLERFGAPGKTLLGSDSHTPTGGGLGMIAIGAGGLDIAVAMAGGPFYLTMPNILGVRLVGQLSPWVSAKDIILELLRRLTVKGGVGRMVEYFGPGVATLSVPERATVTNMGAELGATTSLFPSDEVTQAFLARQGRADAFRALAADPDAAYEEIIEIDLAALEPMVAAPHSPDAVKTVRDCAGTAVQQVCVGSCTNSSYRDLAIVAAALRGKTVHPQVSLTISPGSKQVFEMIAASGVLSDLITSGARILESGCGPCIGMGQAPSTNAVSVRTFNRNFEGRSGTRSAQVFLASPEVAAAAALTGALTDPRTLGPVPALREFDGQPDIADQMILAPAASPDGCDVLRGPNIKPLPIHPGFTETLVGEVLLKVGDNITTDHIMPAGAKVLPLRSNIPAISAYVFEREDATFASRAQAAGGGFIVGGANYGQGSSREHAALAPMYLGVKAVIVKSFARIHKANLINFGILPLTLAEAADYERVAQGAQLQIAEVPARLRAGQPLSLTSADGSVSIPLQCELTPRQVEIILAGGLLNYMRHGAEAAASA
ncbi:MAG TPA: aconitate hydratase [Armatimonadota bacterium]|jgi:aconitate hydratase